ncbi:MAG: hypothetical protein AAF487_12105 [Bacteroidota bacterium]
MKESVWILCVFLLFTSACEKEENNEEMQEENEFTQEMFIFEDDFETQSNNLDELFPADGSRWSGIQQVNTETGDNHISLSTLHSSLSTQSLYMFSKATDQTLSKIDIEKNGFKAYPGASLRFEADFFIANDVNLENLFLFDLESCSCWDPNVPNNQCPGIRLKFGGNGDYLSLERGKLGLETIGQAAYSFPKNQWVNVILELVLSSDDDASNVLIIDGNEVINSSLSNLPNQEVFETLFAQEGIAFQLQEPLFYERFQLGATANSSAEDIDVFIDKVKFSIE